MPTIPPKSLFPATSLCPNPSCVCTLTREKESETTSRHKILLDQYYMTYPMPAIRPSIGSSDGDGEDRGGESSLPSSSFKRSIFSFSVTTRRRQQQYNRHPSQERGGRSTKITISHPFVLLALLLLAALMSLSNIRGAERFIQHDEDYNDPRLDNNDIKRVLSPPLSSSKSIKRTTTKYRSRRALDAPTGNITTTTTSIYENKLVRAATQSSSSPSPRFRPIHQNNDDDSHHSEQQQQHHPFTLPNENNTIITMISMGKLVDSYVVERCIRSIRVRGQFTGTIFLFTDERGASIYNHSMKWDNGNTYIIQAWEEDLHPMMTPTILTAETTTEIANKRVIGDENHLHQTEKDSQQQQQPPQQPKKYAQQTMIYKRFKTHHFKYVDALLSSSGVDDAEQRRMHRSSTDIRYVLYMDVDIIIGDPLASFFQDYNTAVTDQYKQWQDQYPTDKISITTKTTGITLPEERSQQQQQQSQQQQLSAFGFISMFKDTHLKGKMHGGAILYDRYFEKQCTDGWRYEMDTYWHSSDQIMLLRVLNNFTQYKCVSMELPSKHLAFASKRLMRGSREGTKRRRRAALPTFMHITNYRVRNMMDEVTLQEDFVRHVLRLTNVNETMVEGIQWEQVVPPNGGNRSNPI
jgi:hypothetical protein